LKSYNPLEEKEKSSATKSLALSFYTFLSRILGLIRDHYMAVTFGTGWVASAFSIAYRLPNMYRNLLAEGTLSQSFMPIYSDAEKESKEEAAKVSGTVLTFLFTILSIFVAIFIIIAPYLLPLLVGGTKDYQDLVIKLSLILFILIMTASLSSIYMAISNTHQRFFVPSLSPIILNFSYIFVFIFIINNYLEMIDKVTILCYGIVIGGIVQLLVQSFYVRSKGYSPRLNFQWKHSAIKKIFSLMIPAVIGGGFYQISLLVDIFLANYIQNKNPGLGAVVSLDYSQRLIQFPTGIIGVALATTILPSLLASLKKDEKEKIPSELMSVLQFSLFLTLPAALGFLILGRSIIDSIFFGGKWGYESTDSTLKALRFYALAIPFFSLNKILTSSYYAFKDTKTPLKINMISFSVNIILNILLMNFLKHAGLALSSAISAFITFFFLYKNLKVHSIAIPSRFLKNILFKYIFPLTGLIITLAFFELILYEFIIVIFLEKNLSFANASRIYLGISISTSIAVYFFGSYKMKIDEFEIIFGKFLQKLK
jgi:putative peptidoglycan lipid II flippase